METIYNAYKIEDKGDLFIFQSLGQMDFKVRIDYAHYYQMQLPQSVYKITMPVTLMQWYNNLKAKMNKDHEPKQID